MKKLKSWILKNKLEFIFILLIFVTAAFFRFYDIPGYMTFLGDEGRDALVIKKLLTQGDIPFIGPPTSVGNVYLGPLYYYMMALPMAVFWLNPAAAAFQVALIGVLTTFSIYFLARHWFNPLSAAIVSFLYAISPITITYSKSSWNPNPAPFFALLSIFGFYKIHRQGIFMWFIFTGAFLAATIQMHYLALILVPIIGVLWLYELSLSLRKKLPRKNIFIGTLGGVLAFWVVMLPLVLFDFKHNFLNFRAIQGLFTSSGTLGLDHINLTTRAVMIFKDDLVGRYLAGQQPVLAIILSLIIIFPIVWAFYQKLKNHQKLKWPYLALTVYLIFGILGLTLYKQAIYDHYLGFLSPVPYLLLGAFIYLIPNIPILARKLTYGILGILFFALVIVNLQKNPLQYPPNNQLSRTQEIAKFVIEKSGGEDFNFALLAEHNYDSAYQFYMEVYGYSPKKVPENKTSQLFVVCEDQICQPINSPKYEIAAYGYAKVSEEWTVNGLKVYKLIPNPLGKPQ